VFRANTPGPADDTFELLRGTWEIRVGHRASGEGVGVDMAEAEAGHSFAQPQPQPLTAELRVE